MRDITLEETVYFNFTTRAFATGVPTTLAGSPVLSVLESNNATPITAGVSVSVDRATVTGLNQATVVATAANGYEAGKSYSVYISTGTVGGVSVVGEVVAQFTVQSGAAFTRLGAPAGASVSADVAAIKSDSAAILVDTADMQPKLGTPAGASMSADIAAVKTDTAAILVDTGTDGVVVIPAHRAANHSDFAQAGNANSITLAATASATNDIYKGQKISICGGTGDGQTRGVASYNGTTKVATVARNWTVAPDVTSVYRIEYDFGPRVDQNLDVNVANNGADLTSIPWNAAWDAEVQSECSDALIADASVAAIKAKTDSLTFTVAGQVDANVQYINDVAITGNGSTVPFNV